MRDLAQRLHGTCASAALKHVIMPALAITLIATPALAGLDQDTKTVGATTITCQLRGSQRHRVDETIEMSVHWTVDEGLVRPARSTCGSPARRVGRRFFVIRKNMGD